MLINYVTVRAVREVLKIKRLECGNPNKIG